MRVLHVIDSLAGSGGAEQGLVREVTRFSSDIDQMVVTLYDRNELRDQLLSSGIAVESLGMVEGSGSRRWVSAVSPLARFAGDFKPDVLQSSLFLGNLVGQQVAARSGIPILSNLVLSGDVNLLKQNQPNASTWRAAALRRLAGHAARRSGAWFRALTREVAISNTRQLGVDSNRAVVIPRGVEVPKTTGRSREMLGLPEGPLVMNTGRLATQKGQVHLVRAFGGVIEHNDDVRLVIIGRPGDAADAVMAAVADSGYSDRIVILGHSDHLMELLNHATVFAFSSTMEGLGTVVLEAMSLGLPIVAFDIPPVREATADGQFGELVPVGDVGALGRGIAEALNTQTKRSTEAIEWVRSNHDPDAVAASVQELLAAVAHGRVDSPH